MGKHIGSVSCVCVTLLWCICTGASVAFVTGDGVFTESEGLSIPVEFVLNNLPAGGLGSELRVVISITAEETGMW